MSVHTADSKFSFHLPSLSYIDAKWEEPSLRTAAVAPNNRGLVGWISRQVAAFVAWRRDSIAAAELAVMSDRELLDIGLSRSDISRVFDPALNQDLHQRGTRA